MEMLRRAIRTTGRRGHDSILATLLLLLVPAWSAASGAVVTRATVCEVPGCDGADIRFQGDTTASPRPTFGFSVALGHLNGDPLADLVVGAPGEGRVYVFFGGVDNCSPAEGVADRTYLASEADVILTATGAAGLGFSIHAAPRTSATDLMNPLIIGAPAVKASPAQPGAAFVVPSASFAPGGVFAPPAGPFSCPKSPVSFDLTGTASVVRLNGVADNDETGYAVAIGPVLAAGADDYIVSARRASSREGVVYVVPAGTAGPVDLGGASIAKVFGSIADQGLGEFLAVADFLAGGFDEIAIGAVGIVPSDTTNPPGRIYIVPVSAGAAVDLASAAGIPRVRGHSLNDFFGFSLAAGDFDNDGLVDLAAGAIYADNVDTENPCAPTTNQKNAGAVYVFENLDLQMLPTSDTMNPVGAAPDANSEATHIFWGERKWDQLGFALAAGDVNGDLGGGNLPDPIADLVVSARWHDRDMIGVCDTGTLLCTAGRVGQSCATNADCNDLDVADEGAVYVFHGFADLFNPALVPICNVGTSTCTSGQVGAPCVSATDCTWPTCLDCATTACATNPPGVDAMIFGGDFDTGLSSSDEMGFSLAVGDFNQDSQDIAFRRTFADIAVSSITHDRVYLVSLDNGDTPPTMTGQEEDPSGGVRRDVRDREDDGDGYLDVGEDCNTNGRLEAGESDPLVPNRDLRVVLATSDGSASSIQCGQTRAFKVTLTNASPRLAIAVADLRLQITIPAPLVYTADMTFVNGVKFPAGSDGGVFPFAASTAVPCSGANLAAGATCDVEFTIQVMPCPGSAAGSTLAAVAIPVTDELSTSHSCQSVAPNNANLFVPLECPDLTVTKTDSPASVVAGTNVTYTVTVSNAGGSAPALGVISTDTLPAGFTLVSTSGCSNDPSGVPTCDLGTIPDGVGGQAIYTITAAVGACELGAHTNNVTVSSTNAELVCTNNDDTEDTDVIGQANLSLTKTDDEPPGGVDAEAPFNYFLDVVNAGPSCANMLSVTDSVPAGVTVNGASGTGWTCNVVGQDVTCTRPTLAVVAAPRITIQVTAQLPGNQTVTDSATISSATTDLVAGNDTDAEDTFIKPPPTIAISDMMVTEGNAPGTVNAVFTVSLSAASSLDVMVDFATADGTATTAGVDYTAVMGTVTFMPGDTSETVTVVVNGDDTDEPDENFVVDLSSAVHAIITDSQGVGTIRNDDASIAINDVMVTEGNAPGTVNAVFTVSLANASTATVTVDFATADGTATTAGGDYTAAMGTVTFMPGDTSEMVTVVVNGDDTDEPDETFSVNLSNPVPGTATISDPLGVGTIRNDDASIAINDVMVTEGNAPGTVDAVFTVSLANASTATVTVDFATADGTATTGDGDYAAAMGTVTFLPGDTSETVTVVVNGDAMDEPDQTFLVNLSNPMPGTAVIADAQGTGTIQNDDATLTINSVVVTEGDAGTTDAVFTVSLANASSETVTVDYATSGGTATAGTDYVAVGTTTLTFNPGETSKMVTVMVSGDTTDEPDETFDVVLSSPGSSPGGTAVLGAPSTGVGTITDDDPMLLPSPGDDLALDLAQNSVSWESILGADRYHLYRGSLSVLRSSGVYTQDSSSTPDAGRYCGLQSSPEEDPYVPAVGEATFYLMTIDNGLTEGSLGRDSAGAERPNTLPCRP